ncbi:unnamed protein product [Moneuplotes crassus]|uniref:ABC transporter domain-containing protein n=1 Tax=Euplotes crassus TaxID=5936 RepID=A0AAD1Y1L0_EUPCR|nr:unnamed protein product [Moneuplotes crassus]
MLIFKLCKKNFSLMHSKLFSLLQTVLILVVFLLLMFISIWISPPEIPLATNLSLGYQWGPDSMFQPHMGSEKPCMACDSEEKALSGFYKQFNDSSDWFSPCYGREINRTVIALAPSGDPTIEDVAEIVTEETKPFNLTVKIYDSYDELWEALKLQKERICFGAVLGTADYQNNLFELDLIFEERIVESENDSNIPQQNYPVYNLDKVSLDFWAYHKYKIGGYTYLQNVFSNVVLRKITNSEGSISMVVVPMKSQGLFANFLVAGSGGVLAFGCFLIMIPSAFIVTYFTVEEKRSKIRELMKIMGLKDTYYWLSWLLYHSVKTTFHSVLVACLMIPIFRTTTLVFFFFYLWFYEIWLFSYSVLIGSMFRSGKIAAFSACIILVIISLAPSFLEQREYNETAKILFSLIPPIGMQMAAENIVFLEASREGVQFSNFRELIDNYRMSTFYWTTFVSSLVVLVIGLYLENVLPTSPGVRKSPWFIFTKSFWCKRKKQLVFDEVDLSHQDDSLRRLFDTSQHQLNYIRDSYFEPLSQEEIAKRNSDKCILVEGICKEYGNDKAITNFTTEMYEGQIYALLGHNGAGKSTIVNVLSGMVGFSKGSGLVYGYDVRTEMQEIRKIIGFCPQKNILYPGLTILDHLYIFAQLKGKKKSEVTHEVDELLSDLRLENVRNKYCKDISQESKRKLSLAISLIGGSKVVFLDEPSSCMDIDSRKEMWKILHKYKSGRIIILITHYMEEADFLGDKIGIMSHGQLICSGTTVFLKEKFGEGYNIHFVKENREENLELERFITDYFPDSNKVSEISHEAIYLLPKNLENQFPIFFKELDASLDKLGVSSYEISMTTLEEVFLRIEKEADSFQETGEATIHRSDSELLLPKIYSIANEQIQGKLAVFRTHFYALLCKRFKITRRSFTTIMLDVILPLLLIFLGILGYKALEPKVSSPRELGISLYPEPQRILYNSECVRGTGAPEDIMQYLDGYGEYVISEPVETLSVDSILALERFDTYVFKHIGEYPQEPPQYGSYYFHTIEPVRHIYKVATLVNSTSQESSVVFPHAVYQAILRKASGDRNLQFRTTTKPMPMNLETFLVERKAMTTYITGTGSIAFIMMMVSTIALLLNERAQKLFHFQWLNGVGKGTYWASNLIYDVIKVYIVFAMIYVLLKITSVPVPYVGLLLAISPIPIVSHTYFVTLLFKNPITAANVSFLLNFLICGVGPFMVNNLLIVRDFRVLSISLMWVLRISPLYCLIGGISNILVKDYVGVLYGIYEPLAPFSVRVAGGDLIFLCVHFFLWPGVLYVLESKLLICKRKKNYYDKPRYLNCDKEIIAERSRVSKIPPDSLAVKLDCPETIIKKKMLLKGVALAIEYGECYCLLGTNGAGKSIALKMLIGQASISRGDCYINGYSSKRDLIKARNQFGYCPQDNPIFKNLTVIEHLEFYARAKRIPRTYREQLNQDILKKLNLLKYKNKRAWKLSEGNKRKLSVAIALLGSPPVMLLDEPSSGMDPKSKRFMWEIITKISDNDERASVVLTTHSMEEAETMSTNMGILVEGELRCFGSKLEIKEKFNTEYQIEVRFKELTNSEIEQIIEQHEIIDYLDKYCRGMYKTEKGSQRAVLINDEVCRGMLTKIFDNDFAAQEFTHNGFGRDIRYILEDNQYYPLHSLIKWQDFMSKVKKSIDFFVKKFGKTSLVEEILPKCRFRVPKLGKPIGNFFNLMEREKEDLEIADYSISQANLEQIFTMFSEKRNHVYKSRRYVSQDLDGGGSFTQTLDQEDLEGIEQQFMQQV